MTAIKLIVGLGNPGPDYLATRHNVGFWFIDQIARAQNCDLRPEKKFFGEVGKFRGQSGDCYLLKPTTFMNESGQAVGALTKYYRLTVDQILVAHDELDLASGQTRLKLGGGHAGHNGLRSIIAHCHSRDFLRLRIGIDRPPSKQQGANYVLARPNRPQQHAIEDSLISAETVLPDLLSGKIDRAMKQLHTGN